MARYAETEVRQVLREAVIDGTHLRIERQLSPDLYRRVNYVLDLLGGKWSRKHRAHVFDSSPAEVVRAIVEDDAALPGTVEEKVTQGFVRTPADLVDRILYDFVEDELEDGTRVLEPSCGDGAIVHRLLATREAIHVTAVEPHTYRARRTAEGAHGDPRLRLVTNSFENFAAGFGLGEEREEFDVIVMNPPFSATGQPDLWIDHVALAWGMLAHGGRLVAIVPAGFHFRQDRRHQVIRDLVEQHGYVHDLDDDAFAESGAPGIRTRLLVLDGPLLIDKYQPDLGDEATVPHQVGDFERYWRRMETFGAPAARVSRKVAVPADQGVLF
ncbi:methyltransferase [Saccharothrix hoggarensis]|uniref:Methyltransferase n=1 Tax=Saccharothrix hoggarensis TaxID=913853 RepID=A0ABW3QIN4_9PSEU